MSELSYFRNILTVFDNAFCLKPKDDTDWDQVKQLVGPDAQQVIPEVRIMFDGLVHSPASAVQLENTTTLLVLNLVRLASEGLQSRIEGDYYGPDGEVVISE